MKKKLRRGGIFLLILMMGIGILTGCGQKEAETSNSDGTAASGSQLKMPVSDQQTKDMNQFKTLNLDGETVTQDVFKDDTYTLVDVWGTYCNPCIKAMPTTQKIYENYKAKGLNVIGLVIDAQDSDGTPMSEQIDYAKSIEEEQGAAYQTLLVPENLQESIIPKVSVIPSYFFVDSKGNMVGDIYQGVKSYAQWENIIEKDLDL